MTDIAAYPAPARQSGGPCGEHDVDAEQWDRSNTIDDLVAPRERLVARGGVLHCRIQLRGLAQRCCSAD